MTVIERKYRVISVGNRADARDGFVVIDVWFGPWTDENIIAGPYADAEVARDAKRRLMRMTDDKIDTEETS